jgi:hypothetical protein
MSDDEERHDIERYLRRTVLPSERHSVASLEQLSASQVEELRALRRRSNSIPPIRCLRFLVAGATMAEVQSFVEKVVEGDAPAAAWRAPAGPRSR